MAVDKQLTQNSLHKFKEANYLVILTKFKNSANINLLNFMVLTLFWAGLPQDNKYVHSRQN